MIKKTGFTNLDDLLAYGINLGAVEAASNLLIDKINSLGIEITNTEKENIRLSFESFLDKDSSHTEEKLEFQLQSIIEEKEIGIDFDDDDIKNLEKFISNLRDELIDLLTADVSRKLISSWNKQAAKLLRGEHKQKKDFRKII